MTAKVDLEVRDASDKRHSDFQDYNHILHKNIFRDYQVCPFVPTNSEIHLLFRSKEGKVMPERCLIYLRDCMLMSGSSIPSLP